MALTTAVVWAFGVILFKKSGETAHPIALNLFKNLFAFVLYPLTLLLMNKSLFHQAPAYDVWMLLLSGALGIGIADTLFFMSLNIIGASRDAIVSCLYSPAIIFFAFIIIDERLALLQFIGVILIVGAVLTIGKEKGGNAIPRRQLYLGIFYGLLSNCLTAIGVVIVKRILERSPLFWAMEVRLVGALIVLAVILLLHPGRGGILRTVFVKKGIGYMTLGSFSGTYLALIFWLGGMKYTMASTAAALNQTSNIFVFIFAALMLKEAINREKIIGIVMGMAGVFLVTFGIKLQLF